MCISCVSSCIRNTNQLVLTFSRTGSKCLPASAIPKCNGMVLHDSHAEVLALRALNRFLLSEVLAILQKCDVPYVSPFVRFRDNQEEVSQQNVCLRQCFEIRRNVSIWMFSTEAPCGDASMEVLIAEKGADVEPWNKTAGGQDVLQGRGCFSALGEVRRKPSRRDAEATLSKSCTDKLTVKQVTSILCFPANLIIAPTETAYLSGLIVPSTRYSEEGFRRAFGPDGRMASLQTWQLPQYGRCKSFQIAMVPPDFEPFPFAKTGKAQHFLKAGNVSAVFIRSVHESDRDIIETILGGVKQGHRPFENDPKRSSVICRQKLWGLVRSIIDLVQEDERVPADRRQELSRTKGVPTYGELKASDLNAHRRTAKEIVSRNLGKWPKNSGDEDWSLLQCGS